MEKKIENIIIKYFSKSASLEELIELTEWINDRSNSIIFLDFVKTNYLIDANLYDFDTEIEKNKILKILKTREKKVRFLKQKSVLKYAAIIVVTIGMGCFYLKNNYPNQNKNKVLIDKSTDVSIKPGQDKAILTLGDGSEVVLGEGTVYQTQNLNSNGEEIVYLEEKNKASKITYNYLTVPRGGQFFIKLSDGTKVWLNSESQLKYPVAFIGDEIREVELLYGEAYFDVTPSLDNKGAKFKVVNNSQEIEVLGTEFNIKAYKDESNIYTTLVEGKVAIHLEDEKRELLPGNQSDLNLNTKSIVLKNVNLTNEISWKEGLFSFEGKPLVEIMKVLSRWYDFKVVFETKEIEEKKFIGVLSKNQNIEIILKSIKGSGIIKDYEINDKTIILK